MQTNERANHWNVAIYYPMTNDPGSIEVQYSIMLFYPITLRLIYHLYISIAYKI
jgi:hypothetical protein